LRLPSFPTRRSSDLAVVPDLLRLAGMGHPARTHDLRPDWILSEYRRIHLGDAAGGHFLDRSRTVGSGGEYRHETASDSAPRDSSDRKSTRLNSSHVK